MDIQEKINALLADEAFVEAYNQLKTPKELIVLFQQNGVEVTEEIAMEMFEPIAQEECELSEDDLDNVSGGGAFGAQIGSSIGFGAFYGGGYITARSMGWSKKKAKAYAKQCGGLGSVIGGIIGTFGVPV